MSTEPDRTLLLDALHGEESFAPDPAALRAQVQRRVAGRRTRRRIAGAVGTAAVVAALAVGSTIAVQHSRPDTSADGPGVAAPASTNAGSDADRIIARLRSASRHQLPASRPATPGEVSVGTTWTGSRMLSVFSGGPGGVGLDEYDPAAGAWSTLPKPSIALVRDLEIGTLEQIWTGSGLLLVGNRARTYTTDNEGNGSLIDSAGPLHTVTNYDAATRTWSTVPGPPIPSTTGGVWHLFRSGSQVLLVSTDPRFAAGLDDTRPDPVHQAAVYDPATGNWTRLPDLTVAAGQRLQDDQIVTIDGAIYARSQPGDGSAGAGRSYQLDPGAGSWRERTDGFPATARGELVAAGDEVLMPARGLRMDLATGQVRSMGRPPFEVLPYDADYLWTGSVLIYLARSAEPVPDHGVIAQPATSQLGVWDPATGGWTVIRQLPEQTDLIGWTGSGLLVNERLNLPPVPKLVDWS